MFNINCLLLIFACAVCEGVQPNFVVILTDDQDAVLGGMKPMKNVKRFIGDEGVTFTNSYTTSPICCPSRASFLTGLYVHNHHTVNNSAAGGCDGPAWQQHHEPHTFANQMHDSGYSTFYAGKYSNEYGKQATGGPSRVPPGWTEWHGLVGNSVYYNYTISNDGIPTHSEDLYLTDVIRDLSINFIEKQKENQPFLMVIAPPAPHQPFTPAPRHKGKFATVNAVRPPNFNVKAEDKHWLMRMEPSPLPESVLPMLDEIYRSRWESLLAVDEMVADLVDALDTHSLLANTYLIFTSDNGYHVGQFSQMYDKRQPYESDIKVPLLIRGPNLEKNVTSQQPVLNIDLAPTILQLAGLEPSGSIDGHPINMTNKEIQERNMLIEYHGEGKDGTVDPKCPWVYDEENLAQCHPQFECKCTDAKNNTFGCIRHIAERVNMKYCMFTDNDLYTEMYDLAHDPYELANIARRVLPAIRHWYHLILANMLGCKGAENCDTPIYVKNNVHTVLT